MAWLSSASKGAEDDQTSFTSRCRGKHACPAAATAGYEPGWWDARARVYEWQRLGARPQRATATFDQFLAMERVRRSLSKDPVIAAARAKSLGEKMERAKREHPQGNTHLFANQRFDVIGYGHPSGVRGLATLATNVLLTAPLTGVNTSGWVVYEHWSGGGAEVAEWAICGNCSLSGIGASIDCECVPAMGDLCPRRS